MPARAPSRRAAAAARVRGKALVWFLVLLAFCGAAAAWWWFAPQSMPAPVRAMLPASPAAATVYRWRDAKGRVQLTSEPPADRPYETLRYDPNLNVMPSARAPAAAPPARP